MEPIKITPVGEKVIEKIPLWPPGWYTEVTERIFVDQFGHQWHSFHTRLVKHEDVAESEADDNNPTR